MSRRRQLARRRRPVLRGRRPVFRRRWPVPRRRRPVPWREKARRRVVRRRGRRRHGRGREQVPAAGPEAPAVGRRAGVDPDAGAAGAEVAGGAVAGDAGRLQGEDGAGARSDGGDAEGERKVPRPGRVRRARGIGPRARLLGGVDIGVGVGGGQVCEGHGGEGRRGGGGKGERCDKVGVCAGVDAGVEPEAVVIQAAAALAAPAAVADGEPRRCGRVQARPSWMRQAAAKDAAEEEGGASQSEGTGGRGKGKTAQPGYDACNNAGEAEQEEAIVGMGSPAHPHLEECAPPRKQKQGPNYGWNYAV